MKRTEILGFGVFLLSLALVTVAVQSRVLLLRRVLARESILQRDLEAETFLWWQRIQSWRSPEGLERVTRRPGEQWQGQAAEP